MEDATDFEELEQLAMSLGATNVAIRSTADIMVDEKLVSFCKEPRCPNYGLSPSCPPHVSGPDGFRELLKERSHVLVIRIVVPSSVLFSDERREVMAFLHELVAKVELAAIENGFAKSKAFAGGSCKDLFCFDEVDCNVLSGRGDCRNPDRARRSMSGYGVNVSELIKTCGWKSNIKTKEPDDEPMSWVAGIVLLG
ncbi:MAG: putative metal-binding protein [Desulforhopalus sp.]|jgi:predicted metal-binding protein